GISGARARGWHGPLRTREIAPSPGPTSRRYAASNASASPRATWMSRRSRSRSPLLSVVADVNLDASESFGFICHLRSQRRIGWVGHGRILRNLTGPGQAQRRAEPEYVVCSRRGGPSGRRRRLVSLKRGG